MPQTERTQFLSLFPGPIRPFPDFLSLDIKVGSLARISRWIRRTGSDGRVTAAHDGYGSQSTSRRPSRTWLANRAMLCPCSGRNRNWRPRSENVPRRDRKGVPAWPCGPPKGMKVGQRAKVQPSAGPSGHPPTRASFRRPRGPPHRAAASGRAGPSGQPARERMPGCVGNCESQAVPARPAAGHRRPAICSQAVCSMGTS
jgi:hypothetical protein